MEINKKITKYNKTVMNNKKNKYIVIHYTANDGDTAKNNADYFYDENREASAHYFIDENEIWQVVEDKDSAWHIGTLGNYYHEECRNSNSIGIEMCSNIENGKYYIKSSIVENTLNLTKKLMKQYNIPIENVLRHYDITRKICPAPFVNDNKLWKDLKKRLQEEIREMERFNTIEEIPEYAKETIKKLIDKQALKGDGEGLDISEDMIRILVINDRLGLYDK